MTALSRITCYAAHALSAEAREALAQDLYAVHAAIFDGLDYEGFRDYVVNSPAWRTWIYVRTDHLGQLVGYTAIHAFRRELQGRACTVIRMEAGTLPPARGKDLTMLYAVSRVARVWIRKPLRPVYMLSALTHPSSYTYLAHYAPVVWPHARFGGVPDGVLERMESLAQSFGLERVDPANPLVRYVNWVTKETPEERARWFASRRPDTRFYLQHNPGYSEGHGLLTLIPISLSVLLRMPLRFLRSRALKLVRLAFGAS
jgi:hypothetical protein